MSRFSWIFLILFSLAGLSIACQSEGEKRATRLREKLHQDIKQIEAVNNKILAEQEAYYKLHEQANHPWAAGYLRRLEEDRVKFPAELADLQSQIETRPNAALPMLSRGIQGTLKYQQQSLKEVQARSKLFSPEAIKKANERWREAWRPKIFSGRPKGPVVFGEGEAPTSPSTTPEKQQQ